MASKYDRWHLCGPPCVYQPFSVAPPAPVVSDYAPAARGHKRPWVCLTDHHRANLPSSFSSSRGSCLNIGELISPGEHESLHRLALSHFPRAFASSLGVVHSPPCSVYSAIPVISPLLRRPASPLLAHSLDWGSAWPGLASSAMRVAAMDADLRIPDIPLAKEEDIDSNKNSQTDEMIHCEEEVRLSDELSGSLEDLVGNFEEKVVKCLKDPDVNTEDIAPVQVRTQDEIMSESQTWWTLTGNFGNIQPLDFHKSVIRQNMMPGLDLKERKNSDDGGVESCDEDELRAQLDMHQLVSQGSLGDSPPQTADQVIEEIDEMLQSCDFSMSMMTDRTMESVDSMYSSMRSPLPSGHSSDADTKLCQAQAIASSPENLQELSYSKLVSLNAEMEQLIQVYNESLVEELALRDELEYEKEMKNSFISLLLSIQNKRRQFANERKRKAVKVDPSQLPQFMTASIPYNDGQNIDNATLASLIKILKAINDDNSLVPTLLTDYILNVVCPKTAVC